MYENFFEKSGYFNFYFNALITAAVMYMQDSPNFLIFPLSIIVGFCSLTAYYVGKIYFKSVTDRLNN